MSHSRLPFLVFATVIVAFSIKAHSQAPAATAPPTQQPATAPSTPTDNQGQVPVVRVRTDEVSVVFTVVDKQGRFVKDLRQEQFKILDNKQPPRQIVKFEAQTNLPLRVGLLIDASTSIRDKFKFEQQSAIEFLQQTLRPQSDRAFVLAFDETWELTQDFTGDVDKLTRGVNLIKPGGSTALWDAIYYACREKLLKERDTAPVRRAIIVVSDGDDNMSHVRPDEALDMAQRAEVIIYAVGTDFTMQTKGESNLRTIAEATGGKAFFPVKLDEVATAFYHIQEELRSQYAVAYRPSELIFNGQFRPIQITSTDKDFHVRARRGYYVPKQSPLEK